MTNVQYRELIDLGINGTTRYIFLGGAGVGKLTGMDL